MTVIRNMDLPVKKLVYSAGATAAAYATWKLLAWLLRPLFSPLRNLPGPKSASWIYGNFRQIFVAEPSEQHEKWTDEFGLTYKYNEMLNRHRLYTLDPRALSHVLSHDNIYQKPALARAQLASILGDGVLVAEGDAHRRQRRVMNPGFGPAQVRALTPIFLDKAAQLRDGLLAETDRATDDAPARVDVLSWLSRATLDIIGLAGFNYEFDALAPGNKQNELNQAFSKIFAFTERFTILPVLQAFIPPLRVIPTERKRHINEGRATMARIGTKLIDDKKAAVRAEKEGRHVEKEDLQGRDLLSLLVRANMAVDVPDNQRLSDEDMLAQIPTFLVAGHETTSTGTTWALFALSHSPRAQQRLRAELRACPHEAPSMEELQALPYLDAVVRETLRVHAPVTGTIRVATEDDVVPLAVPFVDRGGVTRAEVRIAKGESIFIPILAINRAKHIWGEDAHEFRPERWLEPMPEAVSSVPGVWGNMLTFLNGPHACIGYRFSIVEMKALLFTLVRALEFELAFPADEIRKKSSVVTRPAVASEMEKGNQLPVFIRRYRPEAE